MTWGTGYKVYELEMLKITVLLYFLQCINIKVQFNAMDGITRNSVLKISFIHRVQATGS